jgi:hypothetical protein
MIEETNVLWRRWREESSNAQNDKAALRLMRDSRATYCRSVELTYIIE